MNLIPKSHVEKQGMVFKISVSERWRQAAPWTHWAASVTDFGDKLGGSGDKLLGKIACYESVRTRV